MCNICCLQLAVSAFVVSTRAPRWVMSRKLHSAVHICNEICLPAVTRKKVTRTGDEIIARQCLKTRLLYVWCKKWTTEIEGRLETGCWSETNPKAVRTLAAALRRVFTLAWSYLRPQHSAAHSIAETAWLFSTVVAGWRIYKGMISGFGPAGTIFAFVAFEYPSLY